MFNRSFLVGCGVGGSESHLYWRLYFTGAFASAVLYINEIEMRAVASGADQCSGGTSFASREAVGFLSSKAFDNDYSTGQWVGNPPSAVGNHIGYQFAIPVSIVEVYLKIFSGGPSTFDLQYSDDGVSYTTLTSFSAVNWATNPQIFTVP